MNAFDERVKSIIEGSAYMGALWASLHPRRENETADEFGARVAKHVYESYTISLKKIEQERS